MKIKSIDLVRIQRPDGPSLRARSQAGSTLSASTAPAQQSQPRRKAWPTEIEVANPMSRFPRFKPRRQLYAARQWPDATRRVLTITDREAPLRPPDGVIVQPAYEWMID